MHFDLGISPVGVGSPPRNVVVQAGRQAHRTPSVDRYRFAFGFRAPTTGPGPVNSCWMTLAPSPPRNAAADETRVSGQLGDPAQAEACWALPARKMLMAALMSAWARCPHA
jgi:hypothetical protein